MIFEEEYFLNHPNQHSMINKFLLLIFTFIALKASAQSNQQLSERAQIEEIIQLYFDGWATGDTNKLGKAMHASCHLKNYRDGKFIEFTREQYLALYKPRPRPSNLSTRIVSVDITNNMGSAKVELNTSGALFTDYFNLMKTNQGWVITDKVSTSSPHKTIDVNKIKPEKEIIMQGLNRPWSIAFLNEGEALVSEKDGELVLINLLKKERMVIQGFPADMSDSLIGFGDNTGKFDVVIDPDFKSNRFIYVAYAAQKDSLRTTKIIRAVLDQNRLKNIKTLFIAEPYTHERYHYGGGLLFGKDGKLFFTIGERLFSEKDQPALPIAQNINDKRGKIYRINPDGTIPKDNPYIGKDAIPGLYATGIRAAQGLTLDTTTGKIWFTEHGTHQGDEINILKPGANYGWPIKTTGRYRFAEFTPKAIIGNNYTDPAWTWLQTVAPTGLHFYAGNEFAAWNQSLLIGGLSRGSLWRMQIEGETIRSAEELFTDDRVRIRKVNQSPAGKLYIITDETNGKLIRIKNAAF